MILDGPIAFGFVFARNSMFRQIAIGCLGAVCGLLLAAGVAGAQTTRYLDSSGGDDTAAINDLINLSAAGDTVFLNAGTFNISQSIIAKTGVRLVGAGVGSTAVSYTGAAQAMIAMHDRSQVEIAELTLNGNGQATHGIWATNGSGHQIYNSAIQNIAANGHGVHFSINVTDSRIDNNQFTNIGYDSEWGAGIRLSHGSSRNQITGNAISQAGRGGIFGNDGSTDLVIRNNTVTGSFSTVGDNLGIEIWHNCHRTIIENNTLDHWLSVDRSNLIAVRNNTVNGGFIGLELAGGADNVYVGNTVNAGTQLGISASGASAKERVLFSHNSIDGALSWGVQIQPDMTDGVNQLYFYNNSITNTKYNDPNSQYSGGDGFRFNVNTDPLDVQNVVLDSNTISGNAWHGVQNGDWTDKLSLINNTFANNGGQAITSNPAGYQFGSDLRSTGNIASGNGSNVIPDSKGSFFAPANMPAIQITTNGTLVVGSEISFSFDYVGAANKAQALWDLGAGIPLTSFDATYTYQQAGNYRIGLVVWDEQGRGVYREQWLTISAVPEPGSLILMLSTIGFSAMHRRRRRPSQPK